MAMLDADRDFASTFSFAYFLAFPLSFLSDCLVLRSKL